MFCLDLYIRTTRVPGASGGQKRALDPVELESLMVVNHHVDHVGAGNRTHILCKTASALNCSTIIPAPADFLVHMGWFRQACVNE